MGKGVGGCSLGSMELAADLIEERLPWAPYLERELQGVIGSSLPPSASTASAQAEALLDSYKAGFEEDLSVHGFLCLFRSQIAEDLAASGDTVGAIEVLQEGDLPLEFLEEKLCWLKEGELDAEGKSRVRHALASLYFRICQPAKAIAELEEDILDQEVSGARRQMATLKLEALKEEPEPQGWRRRFLPEPVREARYLSSSLTSFMAHGATGRDGFYGASEVADCLLREGYHQEAIELSEMIVDRQAEGSGLRVAARLSLARNLQYVGRLDESVRELQGIALESGGGVVAHDALKKAVEVLDQAGLEAEATAVSRSRIEIPSTHHAEAERDHLLRLVHLGRVDQAIEEASDAESCENALSEGLRRCPDYKTRSLIRHRLAAVLVKDDRPAEAISLMESELLEASATPAEKSLAETKLRELRKIAGLSAAA